MLVALIAAVGVLAAAGRVGATSMSFLDNGVIRLGVDLDEGGVITYLTAGGENIVNDHDLGRQVQQTYWAGPTGLGVPCPGFTSVWNPNGAGDCHGHPSTVLAHANDGKTIYVKSRPLQWAFSPVSAPSSTGSASTAGPSTFATG